MAKKDKLTSKQLMERSESKKKAAAQQESLGKAQIKNKVKEGSMGDIAPHTKRMSDVGKPMPVGKQRLNIAKDMRKSASRDSMDSVNMSAGRTARSSVKSVASSVSKKKKR